MLDRGRQLAQASTAAAGMLAAEDPFNPPALQPLARYSVALYPAFLTQLRQASGLAVPFQTHRTRQILMNGSVQYLQEHSLDPRQLATALLAATHAAGIPVTTDAQDQSSAAQTVVYAQGAWPGAGLPVTPRKGQMLRVRLPGDAPLTEVLRSAHIYVVPRTQGPQAGTALIGATLEDAGYDTTTSPQALARLRCSAAELLPGLDNPARFPAVEAWAGLRPATPDELPILGALNAAPGQLTSSSRTCFAATGHFRNGILLAPATAVILADLIAGAAPGVDLAPFSPDRFPPGASG